MAVRSKAILDTKFESRRAAEEAKRKVLLKAIQDAVDAATSFTIDVADILDTYAYIKKNDSVAAEKLWTDITTTSRQYGIDFANAFVLSNDCKRECAFKTSHSAADMYVTHNTVVLRSSRSQTTGFDVNTLTTSEAEFVLKSIEHFNTGFPQYVEHFFNMVDNI